MTSQTPVVAVSQTAFISDVLAVQHNALVNARFGMSTLEMRLFLSMLGRIGRHDTTFTEYSIPVRELAPEGSANVPYAEVAAMVKQLTRRALDIEKLGPEGRRQKDPDIISIPLMSFASYSKSEGLVVSRFNDAIRDYLLQLRDNFTKAEIKQLQKLKSVSSHRIYWLLKEYATFGRRTISLVDLRNLLGLTTEYEGRFDHFRVRVLDRAKQELDATDMPFTYEVVRQGKVVTGIKFLFDSSATLISNSAPRTVDGWEAALLTVGVSGKSLIKVKAQLDEGYYDEEYIYFVIRYVGKQVQLGKVKKEGGAVFKALTEGYLLADYRKQIAKIQVKQQKSTKISSSNSMVRIRMEDAEAAYETMRKKGKAPATFDENLQQTYLNQGFVISQNEEGTWLIKA